MSLVTRCPKCQNDFLVSPEQLSLNDGLVRCGSCAKIFDGYANLENDLPTLTTRPSQSTGVPLVAIVPAPAYPSVKAPVAPRVDPPVHVEQYLAPEPPQPGPAVMRSRSSVEFFAEQEPVQQASGVQGETRRREPPLMAMGRQPDFLTTDEGPGLFVKILWSMAAALALLALLAQGVYIYRNEIVTRLPSMQPLLVGACARVGCDISLTRHLERISIDASSLQQSGGQIQDGQPIELMLRFTMRNRYDKNQPWPHLTLELKDASGTTVVRKIMAPYQYLPSSLSDQAFAAGQEVNLSLPVTVTGLQINGFQLDKFFP